MKQGGTFEAIVPCKIVYSWHPKERETASEPGVEEEFIIDSMMLGDFDIMDCIEWHRVGEFSQDVQKVLIKQAFKELFND